MFWRDAANKGHYWINIAFVAIGLFFVCVSQTSRLGGVHNLLWGDEVCNNHVYLSAPNSLHDLSRATCYFYKPVADFAIKKWGWFKLITPTETGFSLIPWFYSGLSLLLVLFWPGTRFKEIGVIGVVLYFGCGLEARFSYEAQCYSFSSLMSLLAVLGFGTAFSKLNAGDLYKALWFYLAAFTAGLNSHFFAWPYIGSAALLFVAVFVHGLAKEKKKWWALILVAGTISVLAVTIIINVYPLYSMFFTPPQSNDALSWKWRMSWDSLMQHWQWVRLPLPLYAAVSIMGLFHPERHKRYLGWITGFATGPALYFVHLIFTARSVFPMQERYLIAYVAPTIVFFLIGLDSMAFSLRKYLPRFGRAIFVAIALLVAGLAIHFSVDDFQRFRRDCAAAWNSFRSTPMNYSPQFSFFEKAKSYNRPVLVLSDQCWLLPVPDLYMRYLGAPVPKENVEILNVAGCETSRSALRSGISLFFEKFGKEGAVLIYFQKHDASPCLLSFPAMFQGNTLGEGCFALYKAGVLESWLRRQYDVPSSSASVEQEVKQKSFFRKVLAPYIFYLVPPFFIGCFIFVFYFFRLRL